MRTPPPDRPLDTNRKNQLLTACANAAAVIAIALAAPSCSGRDRQWDLTEAAARGDLAEVKRLFEAGAKLDAFPQEEGTEGGSPALIEAAAGGHDDVVRFFIEHGADLEIGVSDISCPLAVALKHHSTTELLLAGGASANHAVGRLLDPGNWKPPLDQKMADLLRKHGAITQTNFKRVPPSPFLCTGKVITEKEIPAFLEEGIPAIHAALESVGAKPFGLVHVNYTGRNLRHTGPFYLEIAIPFDNDKHLVPNGFYFRTAGEFKCFAGETAGRWNNIRYGAGIIESKLWAEGKAYPTFDMREVYRVWKSSDSDENVVEIQFGIHHPSRDSNGTYRQEEDHISYEVGE